MTLPIILIAAGILFIVIGAGIWVLGVNKFFINKDTSFIKTGDIHASAKGYMKSIVWFGILGFMGGWSIFLGTIWLIVNLVKG